jgi:SAM-dependent methyltransferase
MQTESPEVTSAAPYRAGAAGSAALETLEEATRYNAWVCSHLVPYLGARNLELGAGLGTLTEIIARRFDVTPVDLAADNLAALRRRFAGHPRVSPPLGDFLEYDAERSLDAVYSSNVLEHIEDDERIIRHAARVLVPGGRFVAWVPAGMWLYSRFDRSIGHYRRYSQRDRQRFESLIRRERLPFELSEYRYYNPVGALGWFVKMRCAGTTTLRKRDALMMDSLINWLAPLDAVRLPFGQSALIVLRRTDS